MPGSARGSNRSNELITAGNLNDDERRRLREGETCDRLAQAGRAALLIDGAGYYGALRESLLAAERSIVIAGWDIDSRTPIRGTEPADDGAPETLGPLLTWLTERRRELVVRVLLWDYSVLYVLEREPLPRLNLDWQTPRNVKVCLDSNLPFGASHHEKIVVIDDSVAYCGGLDLTIRRWDRHAHAPRDPDRCDPDGEPYGPFHDLQAVVDGAAARALGEMLLERWNRNARGTARPVTVEGDPWPGGVEADFRDVSVGIARTRPEFRDETELRQVECAYHAAIARARRFIYIENQYLADDALAKAMAARLEDETELEIVIVSPKEPSGWLEEHTMGEARARFLARLRKDSVRERVRAVFPWVSQGEETAPVKIHAKLMIVDDVWLQIGSANLNCRSMGVDRECDLVIEASRPDERENIRRTRHRLLAHHLGVEPAALAEAEESSESLIAALESLTNEQRGLADIPAREPVDSDAPELLLELADPERPLRPEYFVGDLFGAVRVHALRRHLVRLLVVAGVIAAALALWRYTPLGDWADAERLGALLDRVGTSAWSGPIVLACFVVGSFVVFPVTVLIAASAVALGPTAGFLWATAGSVLASALNYAAGRLLPERTLEHWLGNWLGKLSDRLRRGGIVPIMLIRNLPVAPFSVVNVVAGAFRVRLIDFLAGTTLGMLPGIAALTILGDRMRGVIANPGWVNVGLLVVAFALWIGVALGLQSLSNRLARRN